MCNNERDIYQVIEDEINASAFSESEKETRLNKLHSLSEKKLNIMFVGATGSGKSSTINALFDMERARVGTGVDPETDEIDSYRLQNVTIYDTPGLGDGVEKDERTMRMIREKMCEEDRDGNAVIDAVAVIIDSSQKDLGTVYDCINKVLIPTLGDEAERRIVIALNQADMAMKGRHWIDEINHPDDVLKEFLEKKAEAVRERILESTGVNIHPVCYCAGYKEENGEQRKPYNLSKLLYTITMSVPTEPKLTKELSFAHILRSCLPLDQKRLRTSSSANPADYPSVWISKMRQTGISALLEVPAAERPLKP